MHVIASREKERIVVDAYDASGLFERASVSFGDGRYDEAVATWRKLAAEFPDSKFAAPSLYNSGLANERLERHREAADDFETLAERYPDYEDLTDALFGLAGAYERLEAWDPAVQAFDRLLQERSDLKGIERVEAMSRKGAALMLLGKRDQARISLQEASALYRSGSGISTSDSDYYYAMAAFKLGEILQSEMREIELPADESALEQALEKKCTLLLDAQNEYANAVRIGHPHWAAAAAYRIGSLYRELWDDIVAAPPPNDLDDEQKRLYLKIAKERIHTLLQKAVAQWERTVKMAKRLNLSNEWVERTRRDMEEVKQILLFGDVENENE